MKITYNWLKDYLDIKLKPEELAEKLTMSGSEVTSLEKRGNDVIMELEITPNRPDCLSFIGIARETAAITAKKLKHPKLNIKNERLKLNFNLEIKDKDLCPTYTGRIIEGVKVGPSPKWLIDRLEKMGLRAVNNVVDITNFVLFETGQPLHAFDFDKLEGQEIIVRRAEKDEKITTIDKDTKTLSPETLVIADAKEPIAVGGVMGALNSEVTSATRNILLESAFFNPISIRKTSRKLGLNSESSYRFERTVDVGGIVTASDRAASLIVELCGGKTGPIKSVGKLSGKQKKILLHPSRVKFLLGLEISASLIRKILASLGLKVASGAKGSLSVEIPSFRQDLKTEVDLMEEIARIKGYDKFPSTIPTMIDQSKRYEKERVINNFIRETVISLGINEIITYSLIARKVLEGLDVDEKSVVSIKNPLSQEQEIMRPTLIPGLLSTISRNLNRRNKNQKLFELGKIYFEDNNKLREEDYFSIGLTGALESSWQAARRKVDFFYLKGVLESLFERLGILDLSIDIENISHPREEKVALKVGKEQIGFLEKASKGLLQKFDIKQDVYISQINISKVIKFVKLEKRFSDIIKFPSTTRDISIVVDQNILNKKVVSVIKDIGGNLVKKVEPEQYYGQQIPDGKKGLNYSIEFQAEDRTLTNEEVNKLHSEIRNTLTQKLNAQIR